MAGDTLNTRRPLRPRVSPPVSMAPSSSSSTPSSLAMMPETCRYAAPSAPNATAGGVPQAPGGGGAALSAAPAVRRGKWTAEESAYCDRLIEEFKKGILPIEEGTTLRTFVSNMLNCDPMRISKKYTGDQFLGKTVYRRCEEEMPKEDLERIRQELGELEKTYLEREQYNQLRREKRLELEKIRNLRQEQMLNNARSANASTSTGTSSALYPAAAVTSAIPSTATRDEVAAGNPTKNGVLCKFISIGSKRQKHDAEAQDKEKNQQQNGGNGNDRDAQRSSGKNSRASTPRAARRRRTRSSSAPPRLGPRGQRSMVSSPTPSSSSSSSGSSPSRAEDPEQFRFHLLEKQFKTDFASAREVLAVAKRARAAERVRRANAPPRIPGPPAHPEWALLTGVRGRNSAKKVTCIHCKADVHTHGSLSLVKEHLDLCRPFQARNRKRPRPELVLPPSRLAAVWPSTK